MFGTRTLSTVLALSVAFLSTSSAEAQIVHVNESFSGLNPDQLAPGWNRSLGIFPSNPTVWHGGGANDNGCMPGSLDGASLQANDEVFSPLWCGITNTAWVRSPQVELFGGDVQLTFDYYQQISSGDALKVRLVNATVGAPPPVLLATEATHLIHHPNWTTLSFNIPYSSVAQLSAAGGFQVEFRLDPGSPSSAPGFAIDNVVVSETQSWSLGCVGTALPCPCQNFGSSSEACTSNFSQWQTSGKLNPVGTPSQMSDSMGFIGRNLKPDSFAILASSLGLNNQPLIGSGRGALCLTGSIRRHEVRLANPVGYASWTTPGLISAEGWLVGASVSFQVQYREAPLASGITCGAPADDFNWTNSVTVVITP